MKHMNYTVSREPDYFVQSELDRLRVNVGFTGVDRKVIMITSSEPGEGKSFVAFNLWRDFAKGGKRVCLIDADMRKSNLRMEYQMNVEDGDYVGLSHFLSGQARLQDVVYETDDPNAYLIPTVTHVNPSLLFEGRLFDDMIAFLRENFDYIIIDTPPMGVVSDGQRIARKSDGVILVIRAHNTRRELAKASKAQIDAVGCPLLGAVLNRVDDERSKSYYSRSYYSKNYYSKGYYSNSRSSGKKLFGKKNTKQKTSAPGVNEIAEELAERSYDEE